MNFKIICLIIISIYMSWRMWNNIILLVDNVHSPELPILTKKKKGFGTAGSLNY